ncbi:hypothetical protein LCGC14_2224020 [marine sediment metagenome]|uniref:DUF5658 domain-containing protein n=1 Tax=marine sediment metagenome TaxID=412755 RepID=A0A0F9DA83_9ZZZZ
MRHWNTFVVLAAAAAMTAVVSDNATTAMCFSLLGENVHETNPFSALLISHWGTNLTMYANALWALVVVIYFSNRAIEKNSKVCLLILITLALVRGYAAVNNYGILKGVFS